MSSAEPTPDYVALRDFDVFTATDGKRLERALVAADDMAGGLVPDDRFDVSELRQRPLELFVVGVAGPEVFARVVVGWREVSDG